MEEAVYQVTMANAIRAKKKVPRRDRARGLVLRNARCDYTGVLDGWCAMRTPSRARHRLYCDQVRRRQRRGGAQQAARAEGRQQRCIGWRHHRRIRMARRVDAATAGRRKRGGGAAGAGGGETAEASRQSAASLPSSLDAHRRNRCWKKNVHCNMQTVNDE
jgi:hypothetical protein